jgi:hypothetical protein
MAAKTSMPEMKEAVFEPTVSNTSPPPAKTPSGMAWIPGGEFSMGAPDPPGMDEVGMKATLDSRPVHRVYVDGFFMGKIDEIRRGRIPPTIPRSRDTRTRRIAAGLISARTSTAHATW